MIRKAPLGKVQPSRGPQAERNPLQKEGSGRNIPDGGYSPRPGGALRGGPGCRGSEPAALERSLEVGVQAVHFRQGPPTMCRASSKNAEHRAPEDSGGG